MKSLVKLDVATVYTLQVLCLCVGLAAPAQTAGMQTSGTQKAAAKAAKIAAKTAAKTAAKDPAATSLDDYLKRVHAESESNLPAPGSIWTPSSRFARLSTDVRAMQPHDLISVVVSEALTASTDGTVKGTRSSSANAAITALFHQFSATSAAQNLINMNAASALNAQGQSANNSSLSTVLGGEVMEVLPNGVLVVEASRKVEFSQQTQTVVLRGLVRPEDISQGNRVLSTAISDLTLQVRGNGIINDYTHRPNVLVRLLQRALIF